MVEDKIMKRQCPVCGEINKVAEFTLDTGNNRHASAADYPQIAMRCSYCGFTGAWDVEYGWKTNFPIPPEVLQELLED